MREMLKHRHQVGEAFMKTEHVRAGRNREVRAEPVEQRMREFVRDDVVRKAREYPALRRIASRALRGFEIAERKATVVLVIKGVLHFPRVRAEAQLSFVQRPVESPAD